LRGIEYNVGVGGERLVAGHASFGAQVDGLSSDEDACTELRHERGDHVEEHTTGLQLLDARLNLVHHALRLLSRGWRGPVRQRCSFLSIQAMTASPSAGIRAFPVSESIATCATDT
jgi:hypothetical protein